jgi:hypothetical protein
MRTLSTVVFAALALAFGTVVIQSVSPPGAPAPGEAPSHHEDEFVRRKVEWADPAVVDVVILGRRVAAPQVKCGPHDEVWRVAVERRSGNRRVYYARVTRRADGETNAVGLYEEDGTEFTTSR